MHSCITYIKYICIYNSITRGDTMRNRKFKIPAIPPTTNKSIRFPNDIIDRVEDAICGKECTFSAFVVAAVREALDSLDEDDES